MRASCLSGGKVSSRRALHASSTSAEDMRPAGPDACREAAEAWLTPPGRFLTTSAMRRRGRQVDADMSPRPKRAWFSTCDHREQFACNNISNGGKTFGKIAARCVRSAPPFPSQSHVSVRPPPRSCKLQAHATKKSPCARGRLICAVTFVIVSGER